MVELAQKVLDPNTPDSEIWELTSALAEQFLLAVQEKRIVSRDAIAQRTQQILGRTKSVAEVRTCGECSAWIAIIVNKNGKREPVSDQMVSHFSDCPNADKFRRSK